MDPLDEKSKTLSRCGSFYYHILTDDSKAEAEFVSHLTSVNKLFPLGNKIITALRGDCHYAGYYKLIKFNDKQVDWNGMKAALQFRVAGGMGVPSDKMEYFSSSKARELGKQAWILKKEDVPKGLIQVAAIKMQTLNVSPIKTPVYLQVFLVEGTTAPSFIAASSEAVTLSPGDISEWTFDNLLLGTDIYERGGTVAFQFSTSADAGWQSTNSVLYHTAVGAGAYVPSVQFWRLIAPEQSLPAFNRPAQLSVTDHFFMGNDLSNILAKEGTPQPIAFPGGEEDIILPESQELIWDLHIDEHIMVTSIRMDDGTMLYANQDFASQFGKITFLKNPIALFPKMQFMAQSYTGRMPNLYNYLVRADEVYGSIGKMMNYMRGAQSIKALYHASAQAAGLAVIEKDCTIVAVSPLLEGKLYITTAGRYEANYPHTPLKPGTKLPKDYIIGGNQLYRLIGPYDPMPSNITGINLGTALPVPGLIAPNEDITLYNSYGLYTPAYKGDAAALSAYHNYINDMSDIYLTKFSGKNAVQVIKPVAASNKDFQVAMWFSVPSDGQTYTLEFDSGRLELVWEEGSPARLTGVFANADSDEVTSLTLSDEEAISSVSSEFLASTDKVILQQSFDINEDHIRGVGYRILSMIGAETEASNNFSASLPVYPGDNYILRLKYNNETKELLLELYYGIQWTYNGVALPGQTVQLFAMGRVIQCVTLTIKNWNIQSLQRVYTADSTDDELNNYFASLVGADRSFTALDSLKTANGMQYFRYTACPNRCVVACINESYITSQMKLRLMTYLQRELPIGSVLTTANLPNSINETPELTLTFEEMYPIIDTCHIPNDEYVDTGIEFDALDSYDIEVKANFATFASRYNGPLGGVNVPTSGVEGYAPARCIGGANTYAYTYSENWELLITRPADAIEPASQIVYKFNSTGDTTTQFQGGDKVFMLGDGTLQAVPAASPYLIDKGGVPEKRTYWIGALHTGLEQQAHYTSNAYHAYWKFTKHDTGELVAEFIPAKNVFTGQQGFINTVTKTFYPCKKLQ